MTGCLRVSELGMYLAFKSITKPSSTKGFHDQSLITTFSHSSAFTSSSPSLASIFPSATKHSPKTAPVLNGVSLNFLSFSPWSDDRMLFKICVIPPCTAFDGKSGEIAKMPMMRVTFSSSKSTIPATALTALRAPLAHSPTATNQLGSTSGDDNRWAVLSTTRRRRAEADAEESVDAKVVGTCLKMKCESLITRREVTRRTLGLGAKQHPSIRPTVRPIKILRVASRVREPNRASRRSRPTDH